MLLSPIGNKQERHVGELLDEDILLAFLKEREVNGDFISRASDILWKKTVRKISNTDAGSVVDISQEPEEAVQDDSEGRRRLNLLNYEALKRGLLLLSVGIGTACNGYCLLALSVQAALLVPSVLVQTCGQQIQGNDSSNFPAKEGRERIGVRSKDPRDSFYRFVKGCGMALSSPRLVIPAAIYEIWALSHQHETSDFFDFQLVQAMLGMFVFLVAALVQVYRDNEDLS
ncbi:hypothetical protein RJ641_033283 [Dillenia turbinata]|uniref:Uncharacterized protein n=1 Tax=Dillenia turbinata TaxID=194707 RepID=A0AAN8VXZ3_9MAGN